MSARGRTTRSMAAMMATAALAFLPTAAHADPTGLRNCTELTGRDVGRVGCDELVWVDGAEVRMTFSNLHFAGKVPTDHLGVFYVIGP